MSHQTNRAAARGNLAALAALAKAGEDLSAPHKMRTPLIEAVIAEQTAAVNWLLAHQVNLNACDGMMGWTALGWAAANGAHELVLALLTAGADVEHHTDEYQRTPLMAAAQAGHGAVVDTLLAAGANLAAQNRETCTAADLARRNGFDALAARLNALLPMALHANAPAPARQTLLWPDEPLAVLRWPDDFPTFRTLPTALDWAALASGTDLRCFDTAFHTELATRLAPAFASPTAALRSWAQSMHHWELGASQAIARVGKNARLKADALHQQLAGAMALRQAFATPRVRKYPWGGISAEPALPLHMALLDMQAPTASKCVITTLHPAPSPATSRGQALRTQSPRVECRFTLMRKAGQWRIDNWQQRFEGGESWSRQIV